MAPTTRLPRFRALITARPATLRRTTGDLLDWPGDGGEPGPAGVPAGAARGAASAGRLTGTEPLSCSSREQERLARDLHDLALTRLNRLALELSG